MTIDEAKRIVSETLSEKRAYHTACVAACARELALRYGVDPDTAELAGWLHDICKEREHAGLLKILDGSDIMQNKDVTASPQLWHAFAGGILLEREYGISAPIADAVRYHTTGRPGMTQLEKIVYLADYISDDRSFPAAAAVREIAKTDLDAAVFASLGKLIAHLASEGRRICVLSVEAYNDFADSGAIL